MSTRRWALRTATLVVAVFAVVAAASPAAWSHSELERSDPANGGMVAPGRSVLRLWFGEPVNLRASGFDLSRADGAPVRTEPSLHEDGRAVFLRTDPLPSGSYRLEWRALSSEDGHLATGLLVFGAGLRPSVVPGAAEALPPLDVTVLRWVDLTGLMIAIGALAVSGRVLGSLGETGRGARRRSRSIALLAALTSAYVALVTPFVRTFARGTPVSAWLGETWATLADTTWGHLWLARVLATVLAAVLIRAWARRGGRTAMLARLSFAALTAAAVLEALSGHASSLPRLSALAAFLSAVHIVAAGVWAGGLVVLAVCVVPTARRRSDLRGVVMSSAFRTFSPLAAAAAVVLLATGLYEAGRHVPRLSALSSSVYGDAVVAKTVLLLLALGMAGLNLLMVNPPVGSRLAGLLGRAPEWTPVSRRRFATTVTLEAFVLLAAAGLAAVLTSAPTAGEVDAADGVDALRTSSVAGLFITFEALPSGPDRSRLVVHVRSTVQPPPAPVDGVDVLLSGPAGASDAIPLTPVADGQFEGRTTALDPGAWSARLRVHRRGLPDIGARTTWTAVSAPGTRASVLETACSALAVVLLTGLLGAVVLVRSRRRDSRTPVTTTRQEEPEKVSVP